MTTAVQKLPKKAKNAKLRAKAGMAYISHPDGITIEELHQRPEYAQFGIRTLERWAAADRWVELRAAYIQEWTKRAREQLGTRMAQERIKELEHYDLLINRGLEKVQMDVVAPKSLEGLMKSLVAAMESKDKLRQLIGDDVIEKTADSARGLPAEARQDLTEIDASEAAKAALAVKREAMRQRLKGLPSGQTGTTPDDSSSRDATIVKVVESENASPAAHEDQ